MRSAAQLNSFVPRNWGSANLLGRPVNGQNLIYAFEAGGADAAQAALLRQVAQEVRAAYPHGKISFQCTLMNHRFCGVFKFQRQMYIQRQADANGPGVAIFPPKPLYKGLSVEGLAEEIESALRDYTSLGRSIYADEWEELNHKLLSYFGERSVSSFERKQKEVTIRYEDGSGEFMLFVGNNGRVLAEVGTAQDAARAIYEYLGVPSTDPIA